jgi:hypothetical protein
MRWNTQPKLDTRIIKRFLFFPKILRGERRWLEWVHIRQRYLSLWKGKGWWMDDNWVDR